MCGSSAFIGKRVCVRSCTRRLTACVENLIVTPEEKQLSLLRCAGCGVTWLTLAVSVLAENEERCLHCNASLVFEKQPDENISTVLDAWRALLTYDLDALLDHHDPAVEVRPATTHLAEDVQPVYRGHAGVRRCIEASSREWTMVPHELQVLGDRVLTLGKVLQKGGKGATHAVAWLHRLKDGKIVSFTGYLDVGDAVRDLQLEPE
jgi:ketosteroid isomerase-like protein